MTALRCSCGRAGYPPSDGDLAETLKFRREHPELCIYEEDGTGVLRCRGCVVALIERSEVMVCIHGWPHGGCATCWLEVRTRP